MEGDRQQASGARGKYRHEHAGRGHPRHLKGPGSPGWLVVLVGLDDDGVRGRVRRVVFVGERVVGLLAE